MANLYNKFIENFLTNEECDSIIKFGKQFDLKRLSDVRRTPSGEFIHISNEYVNSKRSGTYFDNDIISKNEILNSIAERTITTLNDLSPYKNIVYTSLPKLTFNEYPPGDFLKLHKDLHEAEFGATLTVIYQLNDNYDVGDIIYYIDDKEYKLPKKKGSIFVFDSMIPHAVLEIKDGIRYSMNSWPSSKIEKKSLV